MASFPSIPSHRQTPEPAASSGSGLAFSLLLHAAIAAAIVATAYLHPRGDKWGDKASEAGAIQASVVDAIPLPPKQPVEETSVLAPEAPSPAPTPPKEAAQPIPTPKDIPILTKPVKPPKTVKPAPPAEPVKHPPLTPPPPTPKATSGDPGMRVALSSIRTQSGTASATVQDRNFGARFAYYVDAANHRVSQNWYVQLADPAYQGKQTTIVCDIDRDGTPSNIRIGAASGSPSLDTSALRAVQRVDSFGPLPQGNHIVVEFTFAPHQ
jgi:protein TonB